MQFSNFKEEDINEQKHKHFKKDPRQRDHTFYGMLMAICGAIPLLIKAAHEPGRVSLISLAVYAISLILLYAASTTYHYI